MADGNTTTIGTEPQEIRKDTKITAPEGARYLTD